MHPELASSLALARQRHLLREAVARRRFTIARPPRPSLRRRVGHAVESLGYAFVALGEAIAWR